MKVSIAGLQTMLRPGTKVVGEYLGPTAARVQATKPGHMKTTREVLKNNSYQMVSKVLDGPRAGESTYLTWKGVKAELRDGSVYLTNEGAEFLKLTIEQSPGAVLLKEITKLNNHQLGCLMLEKAGVDECMKGYGTTNPPDVGRLAIAYGDINQDGTLN